MGDVCRIRSLAVAGVVWIVAAGLTACAPMRAEKGYAPANRHANRTSAPSKAKDPYHEQFRQQFLKDRAAYYQSPATFMGGEPIACQLSEEFLYPFSPNKDGKAKVWLEVLDGQCVAGRLEGRVRIRVTMKGEGWKIVSIRHESYVNGTRSGSYREIREQKRSTHPSTFISFDYGIVDEKPAPLRTASYDTKGSRNGRHVSATLRTRGSDNILTGAIDRGYAGISLYYLDHNTYAVHGRVASACQDFGRFVKRSPCSWRMPPTQGVPPDNDPKYKQKPRTMAEMIGHRGGPIHVLQPGETIDGAGSAVATTNAEPPETTSPPPGVPADVGARRTPSTEPPTSSARRPAAVTQPPAMVATSALSADDCGRAGAHQASIMAARTPSMRGALTRSFTERCRKDAWSAARKSCVLGAKTARTLERCSAVRGPKPASADECRRAASHQAKVMARKTPSMESAFRSSFEDACKQEQWSKARVACVLRTRVTEGFENCASGKAAPTPAKRATKVQCEWAAKHQAKIVAADAPSMQASLEKGFTKRCERDKWTEPRVVCVMKSRSAAQLEKCK